MCWKWGKGDNTVSAYWLLRQWQRRAESEKRRYTAEYIGCKVSDIQNQLVRRKVNAENRN